ncbi:MAG: hypothetical protein CFE44_07280 [Burkholderiales bacterium PBB4]|nr:MAG: hypothetical protein CFE44_07280 [Burkholderiales bacterium PBB4]
MTTRTPVTRAAIARHALSVALQWRLLLLWTAAMLLPAALMAWPFWATLSGQLDKSIYAAQWAQQLDAIAIADLGAKLMDNAPALMTGGVSALLLTVLLTPLLNGAVVAAARAPEPLHWVALLQKGLQQYGRMLRIWIWGVLLLVAAGASANGLFHLAGDYADKVILESDAKLAGRAALAASALLMLLVHLTLEAGRAQLAVYPGRTSAIKAWWRGCKTLKSHWLSMLGFYLGLTLVGLLGALALTALRIALPQLGAFWLLVGVVLAQAGITAIGGMRIARLTALVDIAQGQRENGK